MSATDNSHSTNPSDDSHSTHPSDDGSAPSPSSARAAPRRTLFDVPAPIKQLFDHFPLLTYHTNNLPQRASQQRNQHALHVFATEQAAARAAPSYNPACLKWQTYLHFTGIPFRTVASNNHASPSGSLPFLLPASPESYRPTLPVPSAKLQRWAMNNSKTAVEEPGDVRYEAYLSLLDHRIRRAWLYAIYLSHNAPSLSEPLYILPSSTNPFVRLALARSLRAAAATELLKHSPLINADTLYHQAEEAFAALDSLLGDETWYFGAKAPGLFDASVFAYTHLLLDNSLGKGWIDTRLADAVRAQKRLVAHRARILSAYFSPHHPS